jgi:hypothetical protein
MVQFVVTQGNQAAPIPETQGGVRRLFFLAGLLDLDGFKFPIVLI